MLKKLTDLHFSNRFYLSNGHLFSHSKTLPLVNPRLMHVNPHVLKKLELAESEALKPSFLNFFNGDMSLDGSITASSVYAGHQFGYFVPQLGDGRAVYLGEVCVNDAYYELQLKGAGKTLFSRMGDGRAVYRSSVREYLASAHLNSLGVPTTEAITLIKGDNLIQREEIENGAIVCRVAESFIRFGHFEYLFYQNKHSELKLLADYVIDQHFKHFESHPNKYHLFFQEVVKKTAKLFAKWQSIGFCHGVLNTDNMSILGLTLDYGPYGFIDEFDPDFICNHSDHEGRYSFQNQPAIGYWNLEKLSQALMPLMNAEQAQKILRTYEDIFHFEYTRLLREKCGLFENNLNDKNDLKLIGNLLQMLYQTQLNYTDFFRKLSHFDSTKKDLELTFPLTDKKTYFDEWINEYQERLKSEKMSSEERTSRMKNANPKFILRNDLAQIAIDSEFDLKNIFQVMSSPFLEWDEFNVWSKPPKMGEKKLAVSCSS